MDECTNFFQYVIVYGFQLISMFDIQYVIYNHVKVFGCPFVYIAIFVKKTHLKKSQELGKHGETEGVPDRFQPYRNHISSATQLRWLTG